MPRMDRRTWRKFVKKLRRQRNRVAAALAKTAPDQTGQEDPKKDPEDVQQQRPQEGFGHLSAAEWLLREKVTQQNFLKRADELRLKEEAAEAEKARLLKEWEEKEAQLRAKLEEEKRQAEERRLKQVLRNWVFRAEQEFKQFIDFLSGDIETPPLPYVMPQDLDPNPKELCATFQKTAACRFGNQCRRSHPSPTLSQTLLISNFFSHFALEKTIQTEDLSLEYGDSELNKAFMEFYYDVLPEFQKFGRVIQFKVCCNYEAHLRGNVYVQYANIRNAVEAYRMLNGRYFNGKQISLQFVRIDSWRTAMCGLYQRRRCKMTFSCNFLHAFRNPTKEFVQADNDWATDQPRVGQAQPVSSIRVAEVVGQGVSASSCGVNFPDVPKESIQHRTTTTTGSPKHLSNMIRALPFESAQKVMPNRTSSHRRRQTRGRDRSRSPLSRKYPESISRRRDRDRHRSYSAGRYANSSVRSSFERSLSPQKNSKTKKKKKKKKKHHKHDKQKD